MGFLIPLKLLPCYVSAVHIPALTQMAISGHFDRLRAGSKWSTEDFFELGPGPVPVIIISGLDDWFLSRFLLVPVMGLVLVLWLSY